LHTKNITIVYKEGKGTNIYRKTETSRMLELCILSCPPQAGIINVEDTQLGA